VNPTAEQIICEAPGLVARAKARGWVHLAEPKPPGKSYTLSAAGRERLVAAQKRRFGNPATAYTPAGRARLASALKRRWENARLKKGVQ